MCVCVCVCVSVSECLCAGHCTGDHAPLVSPPCLSLLVAEMGMVSTPLPVCFKDLTRVEM